jgi:chromate transporter
VALFVSSLRAGLLTFGGAYIAIPFLQNDAVAVGGWMTNQQFLDGIALSGILPAPRIIFSTFVGYFAGGPLGALAMTADENNRAQLAFFNRLVVPARSPGSRE